MVLVMATITNNDAKSATCSCAGVSLSNSIKLNNFELSTLDINIHTSHSDISELVSGSETVTDETQRNRETDTYLLQASYGITEKIAITAVLSWVEHTRSIGSSQSPSETSSGMGDSLFVASYSMQKITPFNPHGLAFGLGLRAPTGEDSNGSPITFAEDLQPSQGAWGSSIWFNYQYGIDQQATTSVFFDGNFSNNNSNERGYSFDSEWNVSSGINHTFNQSWSTSFSLSYRDANAHQRNDVSIPNTGGRWLDATTSLSFSLTPESSISFSYRLPIARDLKGALQFTTKDSFTLSWSTRFSQK
jgi:hypothetical protein